MLSITAVQHRGGRPKGRDYSPRDLRMMVLGALERVGGEKYLAARAIDTPGPFLTLLGKVLPTTVSSEDGSPINLHLIAAQIISAQLVVEQQTRGQTIVATAEPQPANLLDAPPPTE